MQRREREGAFSCGDERGKDGPRGGIGDHCGGLGEQDA